MRTAGLAFLTAALVQGADFAGSVACAGCHPKQYDTQSQSHHARALRPIGQSPLARELPGKAIRERGGILLEYGADLTVTVRREEVLQAPLEWAFGAGHKAVTPVGRVNGQYFEHRLSWYSAARRLALTPGHPAQPSPDVASALGVMQPPATISRCFNCHAAGVRSTAAGPDLTSMHPGVGCERCHGPGSEHIAQPSKGRLLNAGRFPARAVVEICGECHRSPNRTYSSPTPELDDPVSVRFQPVGFMASRCFSRSRTFSCLNCHDPHQDARPASDPSYAQVCQGCHGKPPGQRSRCARPARDCLSCHMKTSSPLPNLTFTDHRIRIYQD